MAISRGGDSLELGNIENLQLYVDIETENKDGDKEIKRVPLEDDLDVYETGYFDREDMKRNKIKKLDENTYMFYRFDEIQTHIVDYESDYTIEDFRNDVVSKLDYEGLEYSSDRVDLVKRLLENNSGIYDLVSTNRIIQKEQKAKSDFLSENQRLDKQIESLASYILHPKYADKEEEEYIESVRDCYNEIKKKKGKTEQEFKEMYDLKDELDLFNQAMITRSREQRNNLRESLESEFSDIEAQNVVVEPSEFSKEKAATEYVGRDLEIDVGYWSRMGFTETQMSFSNEVINVYEEAINILSKQLGIGQGNVIRNSKEKELLKQLNPIMFKNELGKEVVISPTQRLNGIKRIYNELKSDFYTTKEILATPVEFTQLPLTNTKFDYNSDTWYEDENDNIVELSKNMLLFSNSNTYKGLIANYYNLKDRYYDKFMDDMWYILLTFEELVKETELTDEERFVLDRLMKDYSRKEIIEEYEKEFDKSISGQTIANWVNRTIPNKIRNTYLDSVNNWLYTYKIKGKFKQCSKCNEVKTINNDRYFRKHPLGRDGFQPKCRKCE